MVDITIKSLMKLGWLMLPATRPDPEMVGLYGMGSSPNSGVFKYLEVHVASNFNFDNVTTYRVKKWWICIHECIIYYIVLFIVFSCEANKINLQQKFLVNNLNFPTFSNFFIRY